MTAEVYAPQLRLASVADFDFCWSLYRGLMQPLTAELLEWNERAQRAVVERSLADGGTFIIVIDGADVGWLQLRDTREQMHLGQLCIMPLLQNRGVGTAVVQAMCDRARRERKPLTLEVMTNNRARRLYERLGFRAVGSSTHKIEMRWDPGT